MPLRGMLRQGSPAGAPKLSLGVRDMKVGPGLLQLLGHAAVAAFLRGRSERDYRRVSQQP